MTNTHSTAELSARLRATRPVREVSLNRRGDPCLVDTEQRTLINPDGPEAADRLQQQDRLREALERIAKRKMGGPFKGGQVVGERREMIEIARSALTQSGNE